MGRHPSIHVFFGVKLANSEADSGNPKIFKQVFSYTEKEQKQTPKELVLDFDYSGYADFQEAVYLYLEESSTRNWDCNIVIDMEKASWQPTDQWTTLLTKLCAEKGWEIEGTPCWYAIAKYG